MPRKIRLVPVLRVQGMSDGREIVPPIVDDFTGEVIEPAAPAFTARPIASSVVRDQERKRARVSESAVMLQRLGLVVAPAGNKGKQRKD